MRQACADRRIRRKPVDVCVKHCESDQVSTKDRHLIDYWHHDVAAMSYVEMMIRTYRLALTRIPARTHSGTCRVRRPAVRRPAAL